MDRTTGDIPDLAYMTTMPEHPTPHGFGDSPLARRILDTGADLRSGVLLVNGGEASFHFLLGRLWHATVRVDDREIEGLEALSRIDERLLLHPSHTFTTSRPGKQTLNLSAEEAVSMLGGSRGCARATTAIGRDALPPQTLSLVRQFLQTGTIVLDRVPSAVLDTAALLRTVGTGGIAIDGESRRAIVLVLNGQAEDALISSPEGTWYGSEAPVAEVLVARAGDIASAWRTGDQLTAALPTLWCGLVALDQVRVPAVARDEFAAAVPSWADVASVEWTSSEGTTAVLLRGGKEVGRATVTAPPADGDQPTLSPESVLVTVRLARSTHCTCIQQRQQYREAPPDDAAHPRSLRPPYLPLALPARRALDAGTPRSAVPPALTEGRLDELRAAVRSELGPLSSRVERLLERASREEWSIDHVVDEVAHARIRGVATERMQGLAGVIRARLREGSEDHDSVGGDGGQAEDDVA